MPRAPPRAAKSAAESIGEFLDDYEADTAPAAPVLSAAEKAALERKKKREDTIVMLLSARYTAMLAHHGFAPLIPLKPKE